MNRKALSWLLDFPAQSRRMFHRTRSSAIRRKRCQRSGSRNYRGQFRQIAISSPVYEQRLVVHGASSMANPISCRRSIGSPAILNRAKRRTRRRHYKGPNRQQTQRPQRPSRASNSHHPWHPLITLRRPSASVNLIASVAHRKAKYFIRRSCVSPYPPRLCPRKSDTRK